MSSLCSVFYIVRNTKKRLVQEATNLENDLAKYLNQ